MPPTPVVVPSPVTNNKRDPPAVTSPIGARGARCSPGVPAFRRRRPDPRHLYDIAQWRCR